MFSSFQIKTDRKTHTTLNFQGTVPPHVYIPKINDLMNDLIAIRLISRETALGLGTQQDTG